MSWIKPRAKLLSLILAVFLVVAVMAAPKEKEHLYRPTVIKSRKMAIDLAKIIVANHYPDNPGVNKMVVTANRKNGIWVVYFDATRFIGERKEVMRLGGGFKVHLRERDGACMGMMGYK